MMDRTENQEVPFGAGSLFIEVVQDAFGNKLDPPRTLMVQGLQELSGDGKVDFKTLHGSGTEAIAAGKGKTERTVKAKISQLSGEQLNALAYGQIVEQKRMTAYVDRVGRVIDASNSLLFKIIQNKAVHFGRWDSGTSVKIDGQIATLETETTIRAGRYKKNNGKYNFASADKAKTAEVTFESNGVAITSVFKIPDKLSYDCKLFTKCNAAKKDVSSMAATDSTGSALASKPYSTTQISVYLADADSYMCSSSGVVVLKSDFALTASKYLRIAHTTDEVSVKSYVATADLPAAAYAVYIDPPSAASFASLDNVSLLANTGTAMGSPALVVGDSLSYNATVATGKYDKDAVGSYLTFHADDAGDTVKIDYTIDYCQFKVVQPNSGEFLTDLGMRTGGGQPLQRVALTSPLSLLNRQYAVSDNGTYYIDNSHADDTLYTDYRYETLDGKTITAQNTLMGQSPILRLYLNWSYDGETVDVFYPKAKPKSAGMPTPSKQDDFMAMKFEFVCLLDKKLGFAEQISTST